MAERQLFRRTSFKMFEAVMIPEHRLRAEAAVVMLK